MLVGILVDVSGSMKANLQLDVELTEQKVTRAHAIFRTIINVAEKEVDSGNNNEIFVLAFGLEATNTCDLLSLLDFIEKSKHLKNAKSKLFQLLKSRKHLLANYIMNNMTDDEAALIFNAFSKSTEELPLQSCKGSFLDLLKCNDVQYVDILFKDLAEEENALMYEAFVDNESKLNKIINILPYQSVTNGGHGPLIELLKNNGAPYAEDYIRRYMKDDESKFVFNALSNDKELLKQTVDELPAECKWYTTIRKEGARVGRLVELQSSRPNKRTMLDALKYNLQIRIKNKLGFNPATYVNNVEEKESREQIERAKERAGKSISKKLQEQQIKEQIKNIAEQQIAKICKQRASTVIVKKWPNSNVFKAKSAVDLLHALTDTPEDSPKQTAKVLTVEKISSLVKTVEPYIYGGTPICEALQGAVVIFNNSESDKKKVLFLLTDGEAADGNPAGFAEQLHNKKIIVFTCFLTADDIQQPKQLFYECDPQWPEPQQRLFELSSVVDNMHPAMSVLLKYGWELSLSGLSRLYAQANHPDIVHELSCVASQMTERNDAILNIIGHVSLDIYINATISRKYSRKQKDNTCYAIAIATVFHLAMLRIYNRENGVPGFWEIFNKLVNEFGKDGANTKKVLNSKCTDYRLHYTKVSELGARKAINSRRPVVARFKLSKSQWEAFKKFYKETPCGTLKEEDIEKCDSTKELSGHAVVLMKIEPDCLIFMNSWGKKFANEGFFKVSNQFALPRLKFYDIYWKLEDLTETEKESFNQRNLQEAKLLLQKLPESVRKAPYKCPQCQKYSPANSYEGNLENVKCTECNQYFYPAPWGFVVDTHIYILGEGHWPKVLNSKEYSSRVTYTTWAWPVIILALAWALAILFWP